MIDRIRTSLSTRLGLYATLMAAVIFLAAMLAFYLFSRRIVMQEATLRGEALLNAMELHIEHVFSDVEQDIRSMAHELDRVAGDPDAIRPLLERTVLESGVIVGAIVAFEPDYFPGRRYFAPYVHEDSTSYIRYVELGSPEYDYFSMDWYRKPRETGAARWSEPYFDQGGAGERVVTYSRPLLRDGRIYAICTADVSIDWFVEMMRELRPYPGAVTFVGGPGGEQLLTAQGGDGDPAHKTIRFETQIPGSEWVIGVICPESEVFESLRTMNLTILAVLTVGLLLLFVAILRIVRFQIRPLQQFAAVARRVAAGNFYGDLPRLHYPDEMAKLRDSFDFMQSSLADYTERLKLTTAYKERVEGELRIAMAIQTGILPRKFPASGPLDIYAVQHPAREVGGDMYDFFTEDGKLWFLVGDVSGKGVPAALLMSVAVCMFRAAARYAHTPEGIVGMLNGVLSENNPLNMFATLFVGVLDISSGELRFCNAGHNPPIVKSSGCASFVAVKPNIPVGVADGFSFESQCLTLEPGAVLAVYTDGVTESEDGAQREYSPERLLSVIDRADGSARTITEQVMADVTLHTAGAAQSDDITLFTLRWKPND